MINLSIQDSMSNWSWVYSTEIKLLVARNSSVLKDRVGF